MNTLYTFGCSFTENYNDLHKWTNIEENIKRPTVKYFEDFLGLEKFPNWTTQLADKLGMVEKNCAGVSGLIEPKFNYVTGNCNLAVENSVSHYSDQYQEGDILIIQWTFMTRFRWYDETANGIRSYVISTNNDGSLKNIFNEIAINRSYPHWIDELFMRMKMINELAKAKKFKVYYWTIDDSIVDYKFDEITNNPQWLCSNRLTRHGYNVFIKNEFGAKTIFDETNGEINDHHLGITGHKVLAEIFHNYITRSLII